MPDLSQYQDWLSPRGKGAIGRDLNLAGELTARWNLERADRDVAQRLIDWYQRDHPKILGHIRKQASVTFGDKTAQWQVPLINGVARTVKRISMTYRRPPERKYFIGDKPIAPGSDDQKKIDRMFTRSPYRRPDLNKPLRTADRWSTLLNTTHLEVVYRNGVIEWDPRRRTEVAVVEDPSNILEFIRFARRLDFIVDPISSQRKGGFIIWTDDQNVFIRDDGYFWGVSTRDGSNPYADVELMTTARPIPVVTLRKDDCDDYWGRYGADIVDSFEQACIQLGNMWEDGFMQSGIVLATNTGLGNNTGKKVTIGLKDPITVEKIMKEDMPPGISFQRPETPIDALQAMIDWYIKAASSTFGLPASSFAQEEKVMSGFAKLIDNVELLEDRDERITDYASIEEQLFEFSVLTWNQNHPVKAEHVNPDARVEVTFQEVEFPEAPADEALAAATEIQNNLSSPVDWIMKKHKITSREEAMKIAKEIATENAELRVVTGTILGAIGMPGQPGQEPPGAQAPQDKNAPPDQKPNGKGQPPQFQKGA